MDISADEISNMISMREGHRRGRPRGRTQGSRLKVVGAPQKPMYANVFLKLHVHYDGIIELPDGRRCTRTHVHALRAMKSASFNFERVSRPLVRSPRVSVLTHLAT